MIYSMSGFGEAAAVINGLSCTVTVKGYNSKGLDIKVKAPSRYVGYHEEERLKRAVVERLTRGRVDVSIDISERQHSDNFPPPEAVRNFKAELLKLENELEREIPVRLSDIVAYYHQTRSDSAQTVVDPSMIDAVIQLTDAALTNFLTAKQVEGAKLAEVILGYAAEINAQVAVIEPLIPVCVEKSLERTKANVEKLTGSIPDNDPTMLRELAVLADKLDLSEETSRLTIHLQKIDSLLHSETQVGKEMDYLCQEISREANTVCSKTNLPEIKTAGIKIKTVTEKIREQSMNLE